MWDFMGEPAESVADMVVQESSYNPLTEKLLDVQIAEQLADFYADPLSFVMWAFPWGTGDLEGFDGPDEWQREQLIYIGEQVSSRKFDGVKPVKPIRTAVSSGHGIGKSAFTSWIILWIMATRMYAKGVVTANTGDQLKTKTWGEVGKWLNRSILTRWFEYNNSKGSMHLYHKNYPESWRVDAQTCREENSESFAGLHSASSTPFYIFDEASAVPDKIWEVAEGGLTDGEPMFFVFGNPTRNTGKFAEIFKRLRHVWHCRQIDSRSAKMTNKELFKEWERDWGEDSDFFRVRVRGVFPRASDMQLIPGDVVFEAQRRRARYLGDDPLICGVDVARGGGDECVVQFRRGFDAKSEKIYKIPGEKSRDSMKLISVLTTIFNDHQPDAINVDETGLGGPIVDRLNQLGWVTTGVNFGSKATDDKHYVNKAAEMWWRMRKWLLDGGSIHSSPQLEQELTEREYQHNSKDQLVLETKDQLKKRNMSSPDWADALALTFAIEVPKLQAPRGALDHLPGNRDTSGSWDYDPLDNL